jgi:hypothetical protein
MKNLVTIFVSVIILFSCSFCGATKETLKNPPFKVTKATSSTWLGGQPGVRGFNIFITINNPEIKLDTVYFRNNKVSLKKDLVAKDPIFVGVFTLPNTKHDYNLHENPKREYGNTPLKLNLPFSLKNNEAAISYVYKRNKYYYKIMNVEEIKSSEKY